MTRNEAENAILFLEMNFGKTYPEDAKALMVSDLLGYSTEASDKAVDKMLLDERFLPSPVVFKRAVAEHDSLIREETARKQRRENQQRVDPIPEPKESSEHAKRACQLARAALLGAISPHQLLDGMMHMANTYPNCGWATASEKLRRHYITAGIINGGKQ